MPNAKIKFGPSGLGSVKEAVRNLEEFAKRGLKACEIAFTYSVYIKEQADAEKIRKKAEELGIRLSIHAQYWVNLNSKEPEKVEKSKQRILKCCEVGTWLGVKKIVFHPGFYAGMDKEETYQNIKNAILDIQGRCKAEGYTPELAPETMGKINVFGSVEEISRLVGETGCSCCVDFAHILARDKDYKFKEVLDKFKDQQNLHIHFSGIVYGDKGEKHHIETPESEWKKLLTNLPAEKNITIVNESPVPIKDSIKGLRIYQSNNS